MADISDVVFAVTAKGFAALRSDNAAMAPDLRTVLIMVDGVCPVAQYVPFLQVFAPLADKFELLESFGLLRRVGTVSNVAVQVFNSQSQAGAPLSKLPSIDAKNENSGYAPLM